MSILDRNNQALTRSQAVVDRNIADATGLTLEEMAERAWGVEPATESLRKPVGHRCTEVILKRGSDIEPEPIRWLWPGWIAAGKVHILAGAPSAGKTTISMSLAATITTGGRWPDGTHATRGRVVIWSGEDDPKDTLVPRLIASGADMSCVAFVTGAREGDARRAFDPAKDMGVLRDAIIKAGGAQLLIVDPVVSAVSGDGHKANDVRRGLQPLADLAASIGCAVIGITHLSKGTQGREPTERITGSLSFGAVPRVVMMAARQTDTEIQQGGSDRVLCRSKSNIGTDGGGFGYSLRQAELDRYPGIVASHVRWGDAVEGTAREILATAEALPGDDGDRGAVGGAARFLVDFLAGGARKQSEVKDAAEEAEISWRTIERAKKELKIKSERMTFAGGWVWSLPDENLPRPPKKHQDRQQKGLAVLGKVGGLGDAEELQPETEKNIFTPSEEVHSDNGTAKKREVEI
ncbi:MAG: AAA family ATPase [Proteobacteria bacterium]|nr:AAA family ATPase [Pseudomonadota bacterium]